MQLQGLRLMCELKDFNGMVFDELHATYLRTELELWHKAYLSPNVRGGTILDIGAGNGETAKFFLNHGAHHVICIEPFPDLLYENLGKDPRVTIIPMGVQVIKSDCEGAEENMAIEVHFPERIQKYNMGSIYVFRRDTRRISSWLKTRDQNGKRHRDRIGDYFHMTRITIIHAIVVTLDRILGLGSR